MFKEILNERNSLQSKPVKTQKDIEMIAYLNALLANPSQI
jgi:hypothetical protein